MYFWPATILHFIHFEKLKVDWWTKIRLWEATIPGFREQGSLKILKDYLVRMNSKAKTTDKDSQETVQKSYHTKS